MVIVTLSAEAQKEIDALPLAMMSRVHAVFVRLQAWPDVSAQSPFDRSGRAINGSGRGIGG
jgi:hypothetical protein